MSELDSSINKLKPGDRIDFANITEIPAFEDIVAEIIDKKVDEILPERPNVLNLAAWGGRVAVSELLRPPKFNGSITDISLTVMHEPYERLVNARERGWKLDSGNVIRTREDEQNLALLSTYKGFEFIGNAFSTGRGVIGQISAELWYAPMPLDNKTNKPKRIPYQSIHRNAGSSILRFVTKPKLEKEKFIELNNESRSIAFDVLKRSIRHPITQQMRN